MSGQHVEPLHINSFFSGTWGGSTGQECIVNQLLGSVVVFYCWWDHKRESPAGFFTPCLRHANSFGHLKARSTNIRIYFNEVVGATPCGNLSAIGLETSYVKSFHPESGRLEAKQLLMCLLLNTGLGFKDKSKKKTRH